MGFENEDNLLGATPMDALNDMLTPKGKEIIDRQRMVNRVANHLACTSFGDITEMVMAQQAELAAAKEKLELAERAAKCNADDAGQLMERALAAEKQRDEFAAALTLVRARAKGMDEADEMGVLECEGGVYVCLFGGVDDNEAAIIARVRREAKAEVLDFIADVDDAAIAKMTGPRAAAQVLREYAAALRRGEEK